MSEHLALRSSVGSRSSALPSHQHLPPTADPLASVWIRRLHLTPNPPPPPRPPPLPRRAPPHPHQDAVSTDESRTTPPPPPRSAGFGPFRWSPRPLRGAPVGAWDPVAVAAVSGSGGGCGGLPMLSPFFRLPAPPPLTPVADSGEIAPVRPLIGLGSRSSGYPALSAPMVGVGDPHAAWLAARASGTAYPSHALDMVPIRTLNDLHDRQHSVIPQNFAMHDPSSSSQHDEPFSYWNMGRFRRNTTTSSISPISVAPGNFDKKRNTDSTSFLPLKFRKLSGAI
uniref:Uncharacterized protein n=1 Tax=Arundo donax TaxID=35708 RepID=A0A0A9H3Y5_ARUDO